MPTLLDTLKGQQKLDWLKERGSTPTIEQRLEAFKEKYGDEPDYDWQERRLISDMATEASKNRADLMASEAKDLVSKKISKQKEELAKPTLLERISPPDKTEPVLNKETNTWVTKRIPQKGPEVPQGFKQALTMGMKPQQAAKYAADQARYEQKLMAYRQKPKYHENEQIHKAVLDEVIGSENYESLWDPQADYWDNFNNILSETGTDVAQKARKLLSDTLMKQKPEYTKGKAMKERAGLATAREKTTYLPPEEKAKQSADISAYDEYLGQFIDEEKATGPEIQPEAKETPSLIPSGHKLIGIDRITGKKVYTDASGQKFRER